MIRTRQRTRQSALGTMGSETPIPQKLDQLLLHPETLRQQRPKFCSLARVPIFLFYVLPLIALGDLLFSSFPSDYEWMVVPTEAPSQAPQVPSAPKTTRPTMRPTMEPTESGTSSGTTSGTDVENPAELSAPRPKKKNRARRPQSSGPLSRNEDGKTSNQET